MTVLSETGRRTTGRPRGKEVKVRWARRGNITYHRVKRCRSKAQPLMLTRVSEREPISERTWDLLAWGSLVIVSCTFCYFTLIANLLSGEGLGLGESLPIEIPLAAITFIAICTAKFLQGPFTLLSTSSLLMLSLLAYGLILGLSSNLSMRWILASLMGVGGVLLALHLASLVRIRSKIAAWVALCLIVSQLIFVCLNFYGIATPGHLDDVDRFVGTLTGRGGYFATYLLIFSLIWLAAPTTPKRLAIPAVGVSVAVTWIAEVKFGFIAIGLITGVAAGWRVANRIGRAQWLRCLLGGCVLVVSLVTGMLLAIAAPTPLMVERSGERTVEVFVAGGVLPDDGTGSSASSTSDGSPTNESGGESPQEGPAFGKWQALQTVPFPRSDFWASAEGSWIFGVGPAQGLSWTARSKAVESAEYGSQWNQRFNNPLQESSSIIQGPRSQLLGVISEMGVVGLFLFLGSCGLLLLVLWRRSMYLASVLAPLVVLLTTLTPILESVGMASLLGLFSALALTTSSRCGSAANHSFSVGWR